MARSGPLGHLFSGRVFCSSSICSLKRLCFRARRVLEAVPRGRATLILMFWIFERINAAKLCQKKQSSTVSHRCYWGVPSEYLIHKKVILPKPMSFVQETSYSSSLLKTQVTQEGVVLLRLDPQSSWLRSCWSNKSQAIEQSCWAQPTPRPAAASTEGVDGPRQPQGSAERLTKGWKGSEGTPYGVTLKENECATIRWWCPMVPQFPWSWQTCQSTKQVLVNFGSAKVMNGICQSEKMQIIWLKNHEVRLLIRATKKRNNGRLYRLQSASSPSLP